MPVSSVRRVSGLAALTVALLLPARVHAAAAAFPLALFGNESVATTDGATGFFFNPAAGGLRYPSELTLSLSEIASVEDPRGRAGIEPSRRLVRVAGSSGGFAVGGSDFEGRGHSLFVGLAGGSEALRLGWTGTSLVARGGDHALDHAVGLLSRPQPWLSLGASVAHANRPRIAGERLARTLTLGLGARPFALSPRRAHDWGTRLTVTGDVLLREGDDASAARVCIGGELELVSGIVARGSVEDHGAVEIGVGLYAPRAALHAQSAYDRDRRRRFTTGSLSLHRGEDRSALVSPAARRIAEVRVAGTLGDESLGGFSLFGGDATRSAAPIRLQLERALEDPLTRGVLLDLDHASNMAQLEELRPRIAALRKAGKPVVAYLDGGASRGDLYLAGACDRVVACEAEFAALGLSIERRYYRKALGDWGLRMDRSSYGPFKSAYRNFSVDSTPPADREVIVHNLDIQQSLLVETLVRDRHLDRGRLLTVLDGRTWPVEEMQKAGLIDSIGYREDARRILGRLAGLSAAPRRVNLLTTTPARRAWTVPAPIAVVYASGEIATGKSGNDLLNGPTLGSETLIRQLEQAFEDRATKAVVLRIESPGGSGLASDRIHHALVRLKRETKKPLVISMGGVAASGGYDIAVPGDRLFADRFTRTGSIGVLFVRPSLEGWFRSHDVRQDTFERGRSMGAWSIGRDWNRESQASADSATYDFYRRFVGKVAEGRSLPWQEVDRVAQGRVWMGEDALERKLVDEVGGLAQAIAEARRRAGVPEGEKIRLAEFRRPRGTLVERLLKDRLGEILERSTHLPEPGAVYYWSDVEIAE